MAAINDLISQIENPELRARIQAEVDRMNKQKKFGLVFEEHLPECTPLYDIPVRRGALVALKTGKINEVYRVTKIVGDTAECERKETNEQATFSVADLVTVAEFGEPIYPYLKPLDSVCNAPDSDLWHTLIEADITMHFSCWNTSTPGKWIVSILIRPTTLEQRIGSTTTTMWMVLTHIAIANGCPLYKNV